MQDSNGDGFAGALPGVQEAFADVSKGNIKSANFDLNGLWSPWYTLHKTFAGLRDAYRHTGNQTALDVEVEVRAVGRELSRADGRCDDPAHARHRVRRHERDDGRPYADTGDKRWLDLSYKFEHKAVLDPLKRGEDPLSSLHGNTQVPKLVGSAARYAYAGDKERPRRGHRVLGSRRQSPHLCDRRPRQGRILPRARQAWQHHRRPHRRDLQRLQHAQADAEAVRAAARHPLRRVPRARAVQSHPRLDGPGRRRHLLHGAGRHGRAPRVRRHATQLHVLRRHRHGEPCAARPRPVLRSTRPRRRQRPRASRSTSTRRRPRSGTAPASS